MTRNSALARILFFCFATQFLHYFLTLVHSLPLLRHSPLDDRRDHTRAGGAGVFLAVPLELGFVQLQYDFQFRTRNSPATRMQTALYQV